MDAIQNSTNTEKPKGVSTQISAYDKLTNVQRAYVDYKALGGLITDDDGVRKLPVEKLAEMLGVTRDAIYKAKANIPDFWALVNDRRKELGGQERLAKMNEVWYIRAMGTGPGAFQYFQLWQANFNPDFRMPTQPVEHHAADSWTELMSNKRNVIEGEVVDREQTETIT